MSQETSCCLIVNVSIFPFLDLFPSASFYCSPFPHFLCLFYISHYFPPAHSFLLPFSFHLPCLCYKPSFLFNSFCLPLSQTLRHSPLPPYTSLPPFSSIPPKALPSLPSLLTTSTYPCPCRSYSAITFIPFPTPISSLFHTIILLFCLHLARVSSSTRVYALLLF